MHLVLISDTHCQHEGLIIPPCDILIHAGDWTGRGSEHQTIEFLRWFNSQTQCIDKIFVSGNHDFMAEREPIKFRELVAIHAPTCTYLEDESVIVQGYKFHGSPVSLWFNDWAFNRRRGADIQRHWDMIPSDTEILVTHSPVLGYGDKLSEYGSEPGAHVGCGNLLNTVDSRLKVLRLVVTAHIHEGSGVYNHGNITIVNAAVLDERYRLKNPPRTITLPQKSL